MHETSIQKYLTMRVLFFIDGISEHNHHKLNHLKVFACYQIWPQEAHQKSEGAEF